MHIMVYIRALAAFLVVSISFTPTQAGEEDFKHTNIILIGATGDLAQKYLWRSLFDLFSQHYEKGKTAFSIYGCSRKSPDAGREFMSGVLLKVITCPQDDEECKGKKKKFVEAIQYHQLKTEKHYEALANKMNENTQSMYGLLGSPRTPEIGRLVYLSIPPTAYAKTSALVNKYLRPLVGRPWFRVVIEKPFGHSYESARSLMEKLQEYFTEKEIYRIDHYLGKDVVREILPFRYLNKAAYEPLWNRHHIDRVEVVMKEKVDVQGRTSVYEEMGIVRDVMQNHLTELATLIGMDLPENSGIIRDILNSKVHFLQQVEPLSPQSLVIGQYDTYYEECLNEQKGAVPETVNTPTFAASVISVNSPRWHGVPFILMSGKKLDEKFSYIRLVFKDNQYQMMQTKAKSSQPKQIVFHIGSGNLLHPNMITVSRTLPKPTVTNNWRLEETKNNKFYFGESINDTYQLLPVKENEAYTSLINAVFDGSRHMFVSSLSLLQSWKIWSPAVGSLHKTRPRTYKGGKVDSDLLDFQVIGTRVVEFTQKDKFMEFTDSTIPGMGLPEMRQIPSAFRGSKLTTDSTEKVIAKLAKDIEAIACDAIRERGSFHIALPGGQSPVLLFKYMTTWLPQFPWQQTHIWQVDERCVPQDHPQSNLLLISNNLLQYTHIPYYNIHPMGVDQSSELCAETDNGDQLYENKINKLLVNSTFDFVLLGVGYDGHVASLFPNQPSLDESDKSVMYTLGGPEKVSPKRMSLSFNIINKSRHIGIIILGEKKRALLEALSELEGDNISEYPVTGVKPGEGSDLVWYIDYNALFSGS